MVLVLLDAPLHNRASWAGRRVQALEFRRRTNGRGPRHRVLIARHGAARPGRGGHAHRGPSFPAGGHMIHLTEVVAVDESFAWLGSGFDALTVAVFVIVAPRGAVTLTTSCTPAPAGLAGVYGDNVPISQVTVPLLKAHGVPGWLIVQLTVPPLTVQLPLAN